MSARLFISHSVSDAELGSGIARFLEAAVDGARAHTSALPGRMPHGGEDSLAALKQQIADATAVISVITKQALASSEVPFQLGAAWALGKRLILLLVREDGAPELYLPMGHAETLVLCPEALLELAAALSETAAVRAEPSERAVAALSALFPDFTLERQSGERAIAKEPEATSSSSTQPIWPVDEAGNSRPPPKAEPSPPRPELPSCTESLDAGRALADCVLHRDQGGRFADELDRPFGAFLGALGASWGALRALDDLDVWAEAAENVLSALEPTARHVRCFYTVGFQLATLIHLAQRGLEDAAQLTPELREAGRAALGKLREAALQAGVAEAELDLLEPLVQNLYAPEGERDVANLGRVQERVRELAARADTGRLAASA